MQFLYLLYVDFLSLLSSERLFYLLCYLLREASEEISSSEKIQDQVEFPLRLKRCRKEGKVSQDLRTSIFVIISTARLVSW